MPGPTPERWWQGLLIGENLAKAGEILISESAVIPTLNLDDWLSRLLE